MIQMYKYLLKHYYMQVSKHSGQKRWKRIFQVKKTDKSILKQSRNHRKMEARQYTVWSESTWKLVPKKYEDLVRNKEIGVSIISCCIRNYCQSWEAYNTHV